MGADNDQVTVVRIGNQTYHVKSAGTADYVRELADFVNAKMSEVTDHTHTVDSLKLAILAALNIADEYFATKRELEELTRKLTQKSADIMSTLERYSVPQSP